MTWPDDFATATGILIFLMVLVWWRSKFSPRYDITLHLDKDKEKTSNGNKQSTEGASGIGQEGDDSPQDSQGK